MLPQHRAEVNPLEYISPLFTKIDAENGLVVANQINLTIDACNEIQKIRDKVEDPFSDFIGKVFEAHWLHKDKVTYKGPIIGTAAA